MKSFFILLCLLISLEASAQNWVRTAGPVEDDVFDLCIDSSGILYAVTPLGVNRSTDGGGHWTRPFLFPAPSKLSRITVAPNGNVIASSDSGIFLSTNNADTFVKRFDGGRSITQFAIGGTGRIYACYMGEILYSDNNGLHWKILNGLPDRLLSSVAAFQDLIVFSTMSGIYFSYNEGVSWERLPDFPEGKVVNVLPLPNEIWVIINDLGKMWRYELGGSWLLLEGISNIHSVEVLRDGSVFVSSQHGVYQVKDNTSVIDVTSGFEADESFNQVTRFVEDTKKKIYYAATLGAGVWKSASVLQSVGDAQAPARFSVTPNPFTDRITIHITEANPSWSEIELRNILGVVVWERSHIARTNSIPIEVHGVPPGNYLLVLRSNERTETQWVRIVE